MKIFPTDWHCAADRIIIFANDEYNAPVTKEITEYLPVFTIQSREVKSMSDFELEIDEWLTKATRSYTNPDADERAWATNYRLAKTAWGYTGDDKFASVDIVCRDLSLYSKLEKRIRFNSAPEFPVPGAEVHNYMEPVQQLVFTQKIRHHEWLEFDGSQVLPVADAPNVEIKYCQVFFDFETFAHIPGSVESDRNHKLDCIFMASMCFKRRTGEEVAYLLHYTEKPLCNPLPHGQIHVHCKSEKDLLNEFIRIWRLEKPDFSFGFNSATFDWPYFKRRCEIFGVDFGRLSRIPNMKPAQLNEVKSTTGQKGEIVTWVLSCPGVNDIDLMVYVRDNLPNDGYSNYRLDTVLSKELGEEKMDFPYWRVMQAFRDQNEDELYQCAVYCYRDTAPLQRLSSKIEAIVTLRERANVGLVPLSVILQSGVSKINEQILTNEAKCNDTTFPYRLQPQKEVVARKRKNVDFAAAKKGAQRHAFNELFSKTRRRTAYCESESEDESSDSENINLPVLEDREYDDVYRDDDLYNEGDEREEESYQGATVLDTVAGIYKLVVTGDFTSLYPSIMLAFSIDYASIVLDSKYETHAEANGGVKHSWKVKFYKRHGSSMMYTSDVTAIESVLRLDFAEEMEKHRKTAAVRFGIDGAYGMMSKTLVQALKEQEMSKTKKAVLKLRKKAREIFKTQFGIVYVQKAAWIVPSASMLLPEIESRLIRLRGEAKKKRDEYPKEHYMYRLYEAKQLALKVICNGLYGFTGGKVLPCKIIAELITSLGRKLIDRVKTAVEEYKTYCLKTNLLSSEEAPQVRFEVIGGDTDSVFINIVGVSDVKRAFTLGETFTEWVTKDILANKHIEFGFEKLSRFNLEGRKKRSERLLYKNGKHQDTAKGNAFIRRQYCLALKNLLIKMRTMLFDTIEHDTIEHAGKIALDMLEDALRSIRDNSVDDMAVSSKASTKNINRTGAVKTLYHALKERRERTLCIGERFSLLYVERPGTDADKAETPEYAKEHGLRPDPLFYVKHYRGPVMEFLKATGRIEDVKGMFAHYTSMYSNMTQKQSFLFSHKTEMPFYRRKNKN